MAYASHSRRVMGPRGGRHLDAISVLREALALSAALYCPAYRVAAPGVVACGSRRFAASVWRRCPVRRPVRWTDWRKPNAPSGAVRPVWGLCPAVALSRSDDDAHRRRPVVCSASLFGGRRRFNHCGLGPKPLLRGLLQAASTLESGALGADSGRHDFVGSAAPHRAVMAQLVRRRPGLSARVAAALALPTVRSCQERCPITEPSNTRWCTCRAP